MVKLEVESPWLRALHTRLRGSIPNIETHPTYSPHCTIAYVKKGSCDDLEGMPVFGPEGSPNSTFYVYTVNFHGAGDEDDAERHKEVLYLAKMNESKIPDPFGSLPFPSDPSQLRRSRRKRKMRSVCS